MPRSAVPVSILALLVLLFGTVALTAAQDATPPATSAGATVVDAYVAALNAGDADRVAALYAEDAVVTLIVHDGATMHGREVIRDMVAANLQGMSDLVVTTDETIVAGDRVAWAWTKRGTYSGQFPGLPAGHGQPIELRGVSLLELRDGKIAREAVYFDNFAILTQVGAATPAAAAGPGAATVRVFACPAELSQSAGLAPPDQEELLAACTPFESPTVAPTLVLLPDGNPLPGEATAPGVYEWADLPFGSYVVGGGATPQGLVSLLVTTADGMAVQNPVISLDATSPSAELRYFYFLAE
jgi:steroid delta-isomerase-like uncharacterized protein